MSIVNLDFSLLNGDSRDFHKSSQKTILQISTFIIQHEDKKFLFYAFQTTDFDVGFYFGFFFDRSH